MRWTIKVRLILGFAVLLTISAITGGAAIIGQQRMGNSVEDLGEMAGDLATGSDANTAMLMVRMNVKDFLLTNELDEINEYNTWMAELNNAVEQAKADFQNPQRAIDIKKIESLLVEYNTTFDRVKQIIVERNERVALMHNAGLASRKEITALRESGQASDQVHTVAFAAEASESLLLARIYAFAYIRSGNEGEFNEYRSWAKNFRDIMTRGSAGPNAEPMAESIARASAQFEEFSTQFERIPTLS